MTQIFAGRKSECGELAATYGAACVWIHSHVRVALNFNLRSSAISAVSLCIAFTEAGTP